MTIVRWWVRRGVLFAVLGVGCTAQSPAPVPPADLQRLTILPTVNSTGGELAISGDPLLEELFGKPRQMVEGYMVAKAAALLTGRGYAVSSVGAGSPALRFEIEEWDVDAAAFDFAVVTVSVRMTRAADATPLCTVRRAQWVVPTRGAASVMGARRLAADYIVEHLLAAWPRADRIEEDGSAP